MGLRSKVHVLGLVSELVWPLLPLLLSFGRMNWMDNAKPTEGSGKNWREKQNDVAGIRNGGETVRTGGLGTSRWRQRLLKTN